MDASVDYNGKKVFVKMGSYGIGVSRLVGAIIEAKYDEKKEIMKWPLSIAPYHCAILPLINKNNSNLEKASKIYERLKDQNIEAIIDDTEDSISAKIKKFNLIGIPYQIVLGNKSDNDSLEFIEINEQTQQLDLDKIVTIIKKNLEN